MKRILLSLAAALCMCASAAAQTVATFKDGDRAVFLGNSITDGGEWNELLANPRVKNRGISGDRSSWMLDRLDLIVGGQPRKLFLLIVTNDLAAGIPAA